MKKLRRHLWATLVAKLETTIAWWKTHPFLAVYSLAPTLAPRTNSVTGDDSLHRPLDHLRSETKVLPVVTTQKRFL